MTYSLKIFTILIAIFIMLLSGRPAYAYLDAGTGSMLLQLLLGGLAGLAVILKLFWHKVLGLFGIVKADEENIKPSVDEN